MRLRSALRLTPVLFAFAASATSGMAMPRAHRGPTSPKLFAAKQTTKSPAAARPATQRSIDPQRATQIQGALIKAGYLSGSPNGVWDADTEAAMQKLQSDNGWQTKVVPDARAIIKLGLGPNAATPKSEPELVDTP